MFEKLISGPQALNILKDKDGAVDQLMYDINSGKTACYILLAGRKATFGHGSMASDCSLFGLVRVVKPAPKINDSPLTHSAAFNVHLVKGTSQVRGEGWVSVDSQLWLQQEPIWPQSDLQPCQAPPLLDGQDLMLTPVWSNRRLDAATMTVKDVPEKAPPFTWEDVRLQREDVEKLLSKSHDGAVQETEDQSRTGVTKNKIVAAKWGLPNRLSVENFLEDIPKWLEPAIISRGARGKGRPSVWNPAMFAVCLATQTPQKKWSVPKKSLTPIIREKFPEWIQDWERLSEFLD